MIVADTDILIDGLRGREPAMQRVALEVRRRALATTAITAFELRSGARDRAEREKVDRLLAALKLLPFDGPAAREAAEVRMQLESAGKAIGMADYVVAGICLSRSAILLTRNRDHFSRVKGLTLGTLGETTPRPRR